MRDKKTNLKFDFQSILSKPVQQVKDSVENITLNLPFISIAIKPENKEKKVAREIVIRLADKRVLNSFECCDSCIQKSLASLQEIRSLLVDKQVELMGNTNSGLYILIELILESIRQFFTYIENNSSRGINHLDKQIYLNSLELLRSHIYRCLIQIAKIANIEIPKISRGMRYSDKWELEYYKKLKKKA